MKLLRESVVWVLIVAILLIGAFVRPLAGNPYYPGEIPHAALVRISGAANLPTDASIIHAPYLQIEKMLAPLILQDWLALLVRGLPLLCGFIILASFSYLLFQFSVRPLPRQLAVLFLALDPLFLISLATFQLSALAIALTLLIASAAMRLRFWMVIPLTGLLLLWGWVEWLTCMLIVVALLCVRRKFSWIHIVSFAISGGIIGFLLGAWSSASPLVFISRIFVEFGDAWGLSVFRAILCIMGILLVWNQKYAWPYWIAATLVAASPFVWHVRLVVTIVFALFGAFALEWVLARHWHSKTLRNLTTILVGCIVLFGAVSTLRAVISSMPNEDLVQALEPVRNSLPGQRVLTDPHYAAYVEYFTPRSTVRHTPPLASDIAQDDLRALYQYRIIEPDMVRAFGQSKVRFVFVTPGMREGGVWVGEEEGLLFLMPNTDRFELATETGEFQLWRYLGARR